VAPDTKRDATRLLRNTMADAMGIATFRRSWYILIIYYIIIIIIIVIYYIIIYYIIIILIY